MAPRAAAEASREWGRWSWWLVVVVERVGGVIWQWFFLPARLLAPAAHEHETKRVGT